MIDPKECKLASIEPTKALSMLSNQLIYWANISCRVKLKEGGLVYSRFDHSRDELTYLLAQGNVDLSGINKKKAEVMF